MKKVLFLLFAFSLMFTLAAKETNEMLAVKSQNPDPLPGSRIEVMIGDPNSTSTSYQDPINFFYCNSLSETMYYAEEFQEQGVTGGAVTGLEYYTNFSTNLPGMPINIWMGETELTDLSGGWIPAGELTQVFGGNLDFLTGEQEITVEFEEPFISSGLNIVVMVERVMDTTYYSTLDVFHVTESPEYPNRSIHRYSDSIDYDPYNPPAAPYMVTFVPNTTLFFNTDGMGSLEGHAYNTNNNEPLEGVLIQLLEQRLQTMTDEDGYYIFPGLFEGTYEAHATLFAHSEDNATVVIVTDETTEQDFYLQPAPQVEVTGRVVGSDYPDIGLEGAEVTFSGMGVHEGVTDEDGYFLIDTVYSSNTYQLVVVAEGYEVLVGEATIGATNTDLGDIVVNEISFPAYDVIATQNAEDTEVDLIWHAPNPSAGSFWDFEDDDGEFIANTGWGWGTDNMAGAYSGENVWGTTLNGQYPNSVSYELVTPEVSIPTDDAVLTFWHWYDIENNYDGGNIKISTDGGSSWTLITPVGGYNGTAYGLNSEACFNGHDMVWYFVTYEIGAYQGEDVMFKFHFGSDSSVVYQGWYIDDVYIGIPQDDVVNTGNPNFRPIASLFYPSEQRIIENYNLYRFLLEDEDDEDEWITISEGILDTVYTDLTWELVDSDIYEYAVKAVYTNVVLAEPAISNWVARDYYTNATVTAYDFFDNPVEDAEANFMCQTPDPDGNLNEYEILTDAAGVAYFPMIWKGDYNIRISKENMATYEDEMVPIYEPYTLEVQLTENLNPVTGLGFSVLDDDVSLWWNEPSDEALFDFEADDGEFVANQGWAWGTDNMSGAHSGDNVWGTVLNAQYPNNASFELVTPEIGIPSDDTQLTFWHWMDIESYWDGGNIKISIDGGSTWTLIQPVGGYPGTAVGLNGEACFNGYTQTWTMATFELGAYAGETALFKFHFGSDGSIVYQGWYIDDVRIGAPVDGARDNRILEHYNVYRDEELISDEVTELEFTDFDVPDGTYIYGIRAQYSSGESEVAEVEVEVYPLNVTGYVTASDTPETTPFVGVSVTLENDMFYWETVTDANGEFDFTNVNGNQTYTITAMYESYQTWSEILVVTDQDVDYALITLLEIINSPYNVLAVVSPEDDECDLIWNSPGTWPEYEIIYDDDEFENASAWYDPGNERSVWFTAQGGPCWVSGGSMHIYDGTWPAGNILVPFTAAVWAYDEATGLPGEMLGSVEVTPTDYNWVSFEFDDPIAIEGTEFFLGYIQGGVYPDCAPCAIDETQPTVGRSYEHYATGGGAWVISSYQDWMLRALVMGPTGRQHTIGFNNPVVDFSAITPHKGAVSEHSVNIPEGTRETGNGRYLPIHSENPLTSLFSTHSAVNSTRDRELIGYNIIRGEFGDEVNWATWSQINATIIEDTTYTDLEWINLVDGTVYTYGVRSVYTNDNMSDPAFSNWVGKDMYAALEISLTTNTGEIPVGAEITLEATEPDPDGNYPEYSGITDAAGECTITGIWKGNYDLRAALLGFAALEDNIDILEDVVTYEGMITEIPFPAYNVIATQNIDDTIVDLIWHSPNPGAGNFWDFEGDDGDFEAGDGWAWGTDNMAGAYSGTNVWGTVLNAQYPYDADFQLMTPELNIPTDDAVLTFWHWYDTENYYDGGNIKISTDGGDTWTIITPVGGYPEDSCYTGNAGIPGEPCYSANSNGWVFATFEIGEFQGEDVIFKFHFGSDYIGNYQGWYIDDVYIGIPEDDALNRNRNRFNLPVTSRTFSRNERPIESYSIYRLLFGDEENEENWITIAEGVQDTVYSDPTWDFVASDIYEYAVKAEYTNNVLSVPSISNWVGKDMVAILEVSLTTNIGDIPVGAIVSLESTDPDPEGNYPEYSGITDAAGECTITGIWKGNYDLTAELLNFADLEDNIDILEDVVTYEGMITEMMYPAFDLYVEENHAGNAWLTWHSPAGGLSSFFDFEDDNGEFVAEAGWEWAAGSNSGNAWSGDNCWSTYPGVTYPNSVNISLYTPIIDVPSAETQLMFYHWYDMESWYDGGNVKISTDEGATWTLIDPTTPYPGTAYGLNSEAVYNGNSGGWVLATFDLSAYEDQEVMFRFNFGSDSSVVYLGWDIDDVYVGEPEDRGLPIPLSQEIVKNPFSKAVKNSSRLERMEGYSLFRGFADDEDNFESWDLIVFELQDTTYEDTSWPLITEPGVYEYCVRVQYTGGVLSEPSFSNEISFNMYVPVTINVSGNGGDSMDGAEVVLACHDGAHTYEGVVSGGSIHWEEVWKGIYDLNITMPGYTPCVMTDMWITDTMTMNVVMEEFTLPPSNVEVSDTGLLTWSEPSNDEYALLLEEGFETWPPAGWTFNDADGDSYGWDDGGALGLIAYEGEGLAYSASYLNTPGPGALTPDNWLISPAIQMDYNGQINYFVCAQDAAWAGEHYGVYVSTTGTDPADFTLLFEETMTARSTGKVERLIPKGSRDPGAWYERCVPVQGYTGNIYLAFRHFNVTDMFYLDLDEVTISQGMMPTRHLDYYNVYLDGDLEGQTTDTQFQFTDLEPGVTYVAGVSAHYSSNNESEIIEVEFLSVPANNNQIPLVTSLNGNYPNPFNPTTYINFGVAEDALVNIEIYNIKGQKIKTLVNEYKEAGNYSVIWSGNDDKDHKAASGIYFYKMNSGKYTLTRKMILMK